MNIYEHITDVSQAIDRVKGNQDVILDIYDPKSEQQNRLLQELVQLHKDLDDLEEEFSQLLKSAEVS